MKGYWHFTAISVAICILAISFNNNWFIVGFFLWLFYLYYFERLGKIPLLVSLAFFLLFMLHIPSIEMNETNINTYSQSKQVSGKIAGPIHITPEKIDFHLEDHSSKDKILILFFPDKNNKTPPLENHPSIKYGASCVINGNAKLPNVSRNPGQFDYRNYLLTKGITHQIIVNSLDDITCSGSAFLNRIFKSRTSLISHVQEKASKDTAAWLNALVLGDDSLLNDDTVELFQRWGLSHILAISGLHVGLIVSLIYFLLIKLNLFTKEKAQWIMLFFLPLYALIAGGEPSVWRASTMVFIFIILNKVKLKFSVTDTLSVVFLLLIIFDKNIVYHIGFQLSFIVTFGLILSRKWISNSGSSLMQILQISFVSQMMILPLQIAYFSTVQPLSILLNMIVVPYFSLFVIPYMFLLLLLLPLPPFMLHFPDRFFTSIQNYVITFIAYIDKVADYPWIIGSIPIWIAVMYYILLFAFMKTLENNKLNHAFKYGCMITVLISSLTIRPYLSPIGTITMLDIGQGDAFVIELPYRKGVIFIDAGAKFTFEDMEATEAVYKQIIKPFLYSKGIQNIDAILLSHEDMDHIGSVPFMVEDMRVQEVVISNYYDMTEEDRYHLKKHNVKVHQAKQDEQIKIGGQDFHVLSPSKDHLSPNANSLVLYTEIGGISWLFTGDIGVDEEKEIMRTYQNLTIDVLKVAHHGSNTSTNKTFINQIKPGFALISVGEKNTYGHPTMEVLKTLTEEEVIILRTDVDGAVQYRFKNDHGTFFKHLP